VGLGGLCDAEVWSWCMPDERPTSTMCRCIVADAGRAATKDYSDTMRWWAAAAGRAWHVAAGWAAVDGTQREVSPAAAVGLPALRLCYYCTLDKRI
jgi:hypothetical protein